MKPSPHLFTALILVLSLSAVRAQAGNYLIAMKRAAHPAARPRGPAKQIYELSSREESSDCLKASGVAAYVVSANGTNRGLLLKSVENGFASNMGMQQGDVLLSVNNRVIQTGRDADRVLESTPAGPARVMFVHPSDSGLQLYNAQVNLPKFSSSSGTQVASSSSSGSSTQARSKDESSSFAACERYMIELINHDRSAHGSPAVQENSTLSSLARAYAHDMAARGFFAHTDPDGNDPNVRAAKAGIKSGVSENLAYQNGIGTMQQQVSMCESQMMNEPPNQQNHRGNILDPAQVAVGVGVARGKDGRIIAVQEFCHHAP